MNQFPYEGAMVRKDLLPQTARRLLRTCSSVAEDSDDPAEDCRWGSVSTWHPWWLPATYDLATEVQFFLKDYREVRYVLLARPDATPFAITSSCCSEAARQHIASDCCCKNSVDCNVQHAQN